MMSEDDEDIAAEHERRYYSALHGMQSGVAFRQNDPANTECQPKHLRVGVNSALVDSATVVKLLIAKGIFTEVEYFDMLATTMEQERDNYEKLVQKQAGTDKVHLK